MTSHVAPPQPPRAGTREWLGLAVLTLTTLLLALDASVLFLALPHLSADLRPSSTQLLWIMDSYGFMIAGFLVTMGTLGDRIGRRRLLMAGAAAFTAASVVAAYSTSAEMLIATRALLGLAGATMMPSTLALISTMFRDRRQRGMAIAVWMASFSGGTLIGPVVGGALLENFWWGSVFLLGVPVVVLLLVTAPLLLPEYRAPGAARVDLTSVALSLAAILPVVFGLKELAAGGPAWLPVLSIVAGAVFGTVFVRRQRALPDPLLDVGLFADRTFRAALGVLTVGMATLAGTYLFVTQYLQLVAGLSPLQAGTWMIPAAVGEIVGALLAPVIARRVPPAYVVGAGLTTSAIGYLVLTQVDATTGLAVLMAGTVVAFIGSAPMMALSMDLIVASAPQEKAGQAAAMSETSGELGVSVGIAVLGSVGTAVYRNHVADSVPAGLPPEAAAATADGLPAAVAAAERLPGQLGTALLEPARAAFTSGLNAAAALTAALALTLAVVAVTVLRHVRPVGADTDDAQGDRAPSSH
ncbi:MFS transporter [Pseudonocardia humida]|uniref:MFS transporter n=1 Tax=Pseudonocardia humida TaxID=2800819 RepID=A0ABT1A7T1_9PSEU|nr:MFS transporter [Pseudonocardia humida]MCO1659068.1 MFS transporter [Pseudonocardia humida]